MPASQLKLWIFFLLGVFLYILKRAYFQVTGPNPLATGYVSLIKRAWIPLFVRAAIDSGIFWACFTPQLLASGFAYLGWSNFSGVTVIVTRYAVCAFFFGLAIDSLVDIIVTKVSFLKDFLPQMPSPLPQPAIVQSAIVETKITALESKTTMVPPEVKK